MEHLFAKSRRFSYGFPRFLKLSFWSGYHEIAKIYYRSSLCDHARKQDPKLCVFGEKKKKKWFSRRVGQIFEFLFKKLWHRRRFFLSNPLQSKLYLTFRFYSSRVIQAVSSSNLYIFVFKWLEICMYVFLTRGWLIYNNVVLFHFPELSQRALRDFNAGSNNLIFFCFIILKLYSIVYPWCNIT